jgi:hypothetical protein
MNIYYALAKGITFLSCILEVLSLNLVREKIFRLIRQYQKSTSKNSMKASFHILSNLLFSYHPNIPCSLVFDTDSIVK